MIKRLERRVEPLDLYGYDIILWLYGSVTMVLFPLLGYTPILFWFVGVFFPSIIVKVILDKMRSKSGTCDNERYEKAT